MCWEAGPHCLRSNRKLRLLLCVLVPAVTLLIGLFLVLTGVFVWPLPFMHTVAHGDGLSNHSNSTDRPSSENVMLLVGLIHDVTERTWRLRPSETSQAPPTQPLTLPSHWVSSVTPPSTASGDRGVCQLITEPQCHMLPYNLTWTSSSVAVVKNSEVDMLLRFFSYLSRLSCYRHIMLFGCSLALPQCVSDTHTQHRRVVLPCVSFCEAARKGCESVLQLFNASWPDFLRCSQFNSTPSSSSSSSSSSSEDGSTPTCYTPTQVKGKPSVCGGAGLFLCANEICVSDRLLCNGFNDCDDWSDETHCTCPIDQFRCNTGRCVAPPLVCDGYDDCGDLSDELNCVCAEGAEHRCSDGRCVSSDWLCDGDHDCGDKSDEFNCSCSSQGLMQCTNGQCVPSAFHCDGEDDCRDGSDEENCSRQQSEASCPPGQPGCVSSSCDVTDGGCSHCEPITLELCLNLPYNVTWFPNLLGHQSQRESSVSWEASLFPALVQTGCYKYLMFYACTLLVPKCDTVSHQRVPPCRSLCRAAKRRCESVLAVVGLQWPDDSDCSTFPEQSSNVTCLLPEDGVNECSPSHFTCSSGRCVLSTKRCDGHQDCDDNSDEEHCSCVERSLYSCPNSSVCIKPTMICDGFPDCPLLEDESNCTVCTDLQLSCNNHQCVHRTLWCDGRKHCTDGSDEWNCVSLSDSSGPVLTVYRTALDYQVCADEWNEDLSRLTCEQLGLGIPASVTTVTDQPSVPGRRRWLHVHPEWSQRNGSALQARLEKRSHACHSRRRVSVVCTHEDCGSRALKPHPYRQRRILGGVVSRVGAWPWQCSLQSVQSGHVCGCVLVASRWALTVAHCFEGRESASLWTVVLGLSNLDHPGVHSQNRRVKTIIVHPRYNRAVVDYDISILELDSEVEHTDFVRPVCLPSEGSRPTPDSYCYITGWGHTGSRMPFKLQQGSVRIISVTQCQSYFDSKTITPRMLCAGYDAGTVDSCMGDSGGPLVCFDGQRWTLIGLTSWGSVCFSKVLGPGVYSNVTHFTSWIRRVIYLHTYL